MAEIDKGLIPNIGSSLTPEQEIEQVVSETETVSSSPTEVTENEDGSVDINFDPTLSKIIITPAKNLLLFKYIT